MTEIFQILHGWFLFDLWVFSQWWVWVFFLWCFYLPYFFIKWALVTAPIWLPFHIIRSTKPSK